MTITCSGCEEQWTALTAAHCPTCHLGFMSVSCFDLHRSAGKCLRPSQVALKLLDGLWGTSELVATRTTRTEALKTARAVRRSQC